MIKEAAQMGMRTCIEALFKENSLPDPPLKHVPDGSARGHIDDPEVKFGNTWIQANPFGDPGLPTADKNKIKNYRRQSVLAWTYLQFHTGQISIREKLALFWHNHFVVSDFALAEINYWYYNLIRKSSLDNFKELTKDISLDIGMLLYLDGARNTKNAPNENYARELLELFTVGKGDLAGPGDYTTFTEHDITEMSKILSGWRILSDRDQGTIAVEYKNWAHTKGDKVLSHRFNNAVISENGADEYADLIDVIFQQEACAQHIARKLFRWFIHYTIDEGIEDSIIKPLAQIIVDSHYDIKPALQTLLSSEYFYSQTSCMLKNPIDWWISATQGLTMPVPDKGVEWNYAYGLFALYVNYDLGMGVFYHPDVAGWKAYYQEPQYYRYWINNVSLPKRNEVVTALLNGGKVQTIAGQYQVGPQIPVLDMLDFIDMPSDPNELIFGISELLFPYRITEGQKDYLKEILIPGLPDFEWTIEFSHYLDDPEDVDAKASISSKLKEVLTAMVQMPEFQFM